MFTNIPGILTTPDKQWRRIADQYPPAPLTSVLYTLVLALIPALAFYWGTTRIGWQIGDGDTIKLTAESARSIMPLFYLAIVGSIIFIGYMIHWMAATFGAKDATLGKGIAVAGLAATPLFLAGAIGFYPIFWLALLLATAALCYAVYLLYIGIPIVMHIPAERGFLFVSAIFAVSMVMMSVIMGGSIILWDMGFAPVFTD